MEWMKYVAAIVSGLAAAIPLALKLIEYVKANARAKNYPALVTLVTNMMEQAETMFERGADKKTWVLKMVEASAKTVNFDIDLVIVGEMIDQLTEMSKIVNGDKEDVAA